MLHSCLYHGTIRHRRRVPVCHEFEYALYWVYLDLDESDQLIRSHRLLSHHRYGPAAFCRQDHIGPITRPLRTVIRELVAQETQISLTGPIRLLTQLRHFGAQFSPLNLFYCFDEAGEQVVAVVADVRNTPWNERHSYVLWQGNQRGETPHRHRHPKSFHVSPFMPMRLEYDWRIGCPTDRLTVQLACLDRGERVLDAQWALQRREFSNWELGKALTRYPLTAVRILTAIYYQAFRLWFKKCPFFPHPNQRQSIPAPSVPANVDQP